MALNPRRVRLLGVMLGLLLALTCLPTAAGHADESDDLLVELTSITPTVLSGGGELVISGRVTNQSSQTLTQLEAHLWRDATPITTLAALDAAQADPQASGEAMQSPDATAQLGTGGELAPGATAEFTVRTDLSPGAAEQSWLSQPGAAYQVGVQVFSGPREIGGSSSLIAYPGDTRVDVGTIVLLNARPSLLPLESNADQLPVFADDSLSAEVAGRLERLLTLGEQDNVLVVIDPQLYDEVTALALPHALRLSDGGQSQVNSAGSAQAQAWLDRVNALMTSGRVARGLYGSVDLAQAVASGKADLVRQSATLPDGHLMAALPLVVAPYDGWVDEQSAAALAEVSPSWLLASNLGSSQLLHDANGVPLLSVDPASTAQPAANPVQARGWLLARQLIGGTQGVPSIQLVTTTAQAEMALADESWRTRHAITDLTSAASSAGTPNWPSETVASSDALAEATSRTEGLLTAWDELIELPDETVDPSNRVVPGAWSITFGRNSQAQTEWLRLASEPAMAVLSPDAIQLRISDWVTTSSEDNLLPVTVTNNTAYQLRVRVHFESDNPLRISVADSELILVQPGESATVRVSPVAEGNGVVAMRAQVVTSGGHPVGTPVDFTITAAQSGRVAWIIIVASGVVLLGATAYRVRSMHRENQEG